MKSALIGYGYWGKIVRTYIEKNAHFELIKICAQDVETRKEDNVIFTNDFESILKDKQIETVFVCTPIETHFEICRDLLLNGKHVFCEKPTVRTSRDFQLLQQISLEKSQVLYTDYIYTESPSIQKMKELLSDIGEICRIEGEISQFGNFYPLDTVFEVLGVHLFSVLSYLLSEIDVTMCKKTEPNKLLSYGGTIEMTVNSDIQVFFTCNLLNSKKIRIIKIYGTEGSILFDMMDQEAVLRFQQYEKSNRRAFIQKECKSWMFDEGNNLTNVVQAFYKAITQQDNLANLKIAKDVSKILDLL